MVAPRDSAGVFPASLAALWLRQDRCVYLIFPRKEAARPLWQAPDYPLSRTHPITTTLVDPDGIGGVPPIIYGVARDGITAVLFTVSGRPVNVPVGDNFFAYEGRPFETVFSFSAVTAVEEASRRS